MNEGNIEYHQSVAEIHPNLVLKFAYLKDLEDVDPFNISGVDGGKESEQGELGVYVTTVINCKTPLCGKWKTGDSLPLSRRRGGMQHHILLTITADN